MYVKMKDMAQIMTNKAIEAKKSAAIMKFSAAKKAEEVRITIDNLLTEIR